jgi:hypothetical protein
MMNCVVRTCDRIILRCHPNSVSNIISEYTVSCPTHAFHVGHTWSSPFSGARVSTDAQPHSQIFPTVQCSQRFTCIIYMCNTATQCSILTTVFIQRSNCEHCEPLSYRDELEQLAFDPSCVGQAHVQLIPLSLCFTQINNPSCMHTTFHPDKLGQD